MLTAQTIKNQHSDVFTFMHGDLQIGASHCHVPEEALLGSLVYVSDAGQLTEAMKTIVNIGHLNEIRRNLTRVMKHLRLLDKPPDDSSGA